MRNSASRVVLAFYSREEQEQANRAYQSLLKSGSKAYLIASDTNPAPESSRLYADLRLEGEDLIAAGTESAKIAQVVKTLRLSWNTVDFRGSASGCATPQEYAGIGLGPANQTGNSGAAGR